MHIFAFTIVIVENVSSFERENFGDSYHFAKIIILIRENNFIKLRMLINNFSVISIKTTN